MNKYFFLFFLLLCPLFSYGQNSLLYQEAEQGDANKQYELGCRYWDTDKTEALKWFQKSAAQGNMYAQYALGQNLVEGVWINQNTQQGINLLKQSAKQGFPNAQILLAQYAHNGTGMDKNFQEAFKWSLMCAENSEGKDDSSNNIITEAQYIVACCYGNGDGVSKDDKKSFVWLSKAAERGHVKAISYLGLAYMAGRGTNVDKTKGIQYFKTAAEKDDNNAQYWLGQAYLYGDGIKKDEQKAFYWYSKAANNGNPEAQAQFGYMYLEGHGVPVNYVEALKWFSKAADNNEPEGYNAMAYLYFDGKGIDKNVDKAFELINKSISLSNNNPRYLDSKGEFLYKTGDIENAQKIYNEILEKEPTFYIGKPSTFSELIQNGIDETSKDIPISPTKNQNTFAIIIANEKYLRENKVPYAGNDGKIFAEYCKKTFGIPESNIRFIENATLNDIKYNLNWLKQVVDVYGNDSKVIIYYAGHGIPDEKSKTAYLLPVDGYGSDASTGYSLQELYQTLSQLKSKEVVTFLDACFSGTNRDGNMMQSARGIAIKVKETAPKGNLVVFSASKEDETAYPYKEKQHGMFTYYLLKKLQESKGNATLEDLCNYVTDNVRKRSIVENGKLQNPTVFASPTLGKNWETWKLK